jgi:hypothetical protein
MINFIATALMALVMMNLVYQSHLHAPLAPEVHVFPPPLSVGKQRSFSSGRDASMFTQQVRRQAVVNGFYGSPNLVLRESNHTSGFTNGVLEIYSITGICNRILRSVMSNVYDGGTSADEFADLDAGTGSTENPGTLLDAGNSGTIVRDTEITVVC